jgi:nucleoside-diphosphate-sugar epimerase
MAPQIRAVGGRRRLAGRRGPVVAVTGAAAPVGAAVAAVLVRRQGSPCGPSEVVAVDDVRGALDGVTWRLGDVTDPSVIDRLAGVDVVVHVADRANLGQALAVPARQRRMRAVRAVQAVTTAAAATGAGRLIVVSSAMVYGARPDNPVPLPDDAVLRAEPDDGLVGDLLEIERIVARTPRVHPGLRITVLRPAALVGAGVDTVVTRHFEAPRLLTVRGASTRWQFCHLDDLGEAVATAIEAGLDGPLTAACTGALTWADVEELVGLRRLELPAGLAFGTAERLHRLGMLPMPPGDLALVVHPWAVSAERLRAAGWAPWHTNDACIRVLLEQGAGRYAVAGLRVDRRDAALGAAGAAVALVATAAIVRQARTRRALRHRPRL